MSPHGIGPWTLPTPWAWQSDEQAANGATPKRAIFADPRTGKTLAALLGLRELALRCKSAPRALITAPAKVCSDWARAIDAAGFRAVPAYTWPMKRIERYGKRLWDDDPKDPRPAVVILNDDKVAGTADALLKGLQALVVDESHRMKGVSSLRGRALRRMARAAGWVRLLTGTPAGTHFGNLWGQMTGIAPDDWDTSFGRFADRFLIRDAMFPSRILGHKNVDELQRFILRSATIVRRDDIFGPDNYQTIVRDVDMPEKAWILYHKLAKDWVLDEPNIEAATIIVRLLRLQQLTSGYLPDNREGEAQTMRVHSAKLDYLIADLDEIVESEQKAIVYHRFTWEGEEAFEEIRRQYPQALVLSLNGRTKAKDVSAITTTFRAAPHAAICVVQIQSGGTGISFDEAHHAMYLSRVTSFFDDKQSRDRIYKPGARRTVTYYCVPGSVDDWLAELLEHDQNIHQAVRNADRATLVYGRRRRKKVSAA